MSLLLLLLRMIVTGGCHHKKYNLARSNQPKMLATGIIRRQRFLSRVFTVAKTNLFFELFRLLWPKYTIILLENKNKKTHTYCRILCGERYIISDGVRPLEAINRQDQKSPLPYDRYFVSP